MFRSYVDNTLEKTTMQRKSCAFILREYKTYPNIMLSEPTVPTTFTLPAPVNKVIDIDLNAQLETTLHEFVKARHDDVSCSYLAHCI